MKDGACCYRNGSCWWGAGRLVCLLGTGFLKMRSPTRSLTTVLRLRDHVGQQSCCLRRCQAST